jgi:hypothetical protein
MAGGSAHTYTFLEAAFDVTPYTARVQYRLLASFPIFLCPSKVAAKLFSRIFCDPG